MLLTSLSNSLKCSFKIREREREGGERGNGSLGHFFSSENFGVCECGALTRVAVRRGIIDNSPETRHTYTCRGGPPLIFIHALNLVNSRARLRRSVGAIASALIIFTCFTFRSREIKREDARFCYLTLTSSYRHRIRGHQVNRPRAIVISRPVTIVTVSSSSKRSSACPFHVRCRSAEERMGLSEILAVYRTEVHYDITRASTLA